MVIKMVTVNKVLEELHLPVNDTQIKITESDIEKIYQHAKKELPNEACGLLAGIEEDGVKVIKEVYLLTNIDASNEHFSMDPKEQFAAVKDMRAKGYQLFGNWHSHPESPSRPSEEDKKLAHDSKADYFILSLMDEKEPVLNGFTILNHADVSRETIIIE